MSFQPADALPNYPLTYIQSKPYLDLLEAIGRNIKPLRAMYRQFDSSQDGVLDFDNGIAVFIKFVRETLDLTPKDYDDIYLEKMARPFGEIRHGKKILRHQSFTEALKNRHYLMRLATNNKHASFHKEVASKDRQYLT